MFSTSFGWFVDCLFFISPSLDVSGTFSPLLGKWMGFVWGVRGILQERIPAKRSTHLWWRVFLLEGLTPSEKTWNEHLRAPLFFALKSTWGPVHPMRPSQRAGSSRRAWKVSSIGLWGKSMGAVASLLRASKDRRVDACVLDSPYADFQKAPARVVAALPRPDLHKRKQKTEILRAVRRPKVDFHMEPGNPSCSSAPWLLPRLSRGTRKAILRVVLSFLSWLFTHSFV